MTRGTSTKDETKREAEYRRGFYAGADQCREAVDEGAELAAITLSWRKRITSRRVRMASF